jgi:hypothetical protein
MMRAVVGGFGLGRAFVLRMMNVIVDTLTKRINMRSSSTLYCLLKGKNLTWSDAAARTVGGKTPKGANVRINNQREIYKLQNELIRYFGFYLFKNLTNAKIAEMVGIKTSGFVHALYGDNASPEYVQKVIDIFDDYVKKHSINPPTFEKRDCREKNN